MVMLLLEYLCPLLFKTFQSSNRLISTPEYNLSLATFSSLNKKLCNNRSNK